MAKRVGVLGRRLRGCAAVALATLGWMVLAGVSPVVADADTFTVRCGDVNALTAAIDSANASPGAGTINLAPCTYLLETPADLTDTTGSDGLPMITGTLTINGNGARIVRSALAPQFRIMHIAGTGELTLNDTVVSGGDSSGLGGGILNDGSLIIERSGILHSHADGGGGGIGNHPGATARIDRSAVSGNSAAADNDGGGIASGGALTIRDSILSGNSLPAPSAGGAIESFGTLHISHTLLFGNRAAEAGGIYDQSSMTAAGVRLVRNEAIQHDGGALYVEQGASADVKYAAIDGNQAAGRGGGAFLASGATLALSDSGVHGNVAGSGGGGLFASSGASVALASTLVTGNVPDNCGPAGDIAGCTG